jgi:hypothetical protein
VHGRILLLLALTAATASAQAVVSAMAGYLHQVDGEAFLEGKPVSAAPQDLVHLRDGQRLTTGKGLAEIMLSPGSYVRIGPGSTIEMINAGLLSAELHLIEGVAVIDLTDLLEPGAVVLRVGQTGRVEPRSDGVFRVDAAASGPSRLRVMNGKASAFVDGEETTVKKGREMGLARGASPVKTTGEPDAVDAWQEQRHNEMAPAGAALRKAGARSGLDPLDAEMLDMATRRPGP